MYKILVIHFLPLCKKQNKKNWKFIMYATWTEQNTNIKNDETVIKNYYLNRKKNNKLSKIYT